MEKIEFRKAKIEDLDRLESIYGRARDFMVSNGNPSQWVNGYPSRGDLLSDLQKGQLWVGVDQGGIVRCAYCFMPGPDPTYAEISEGRWLRDSSYHVIHRLASDGTLHGMARNCFEWCRKQDPDLRADTHRDNRIMQHLLESSGFVPCGIILTHDGTERIAYQTKEICL